MDPIKMNLESILDFTNSAGNLQQNTTEIQALKFKIIVEIF